MQHILGAPQISGAAVVDGSHARSLLTVLCFLPEGFAPRPLEFHQTLLKPVADAGEVNTLSANGSGDLTFGGAILRAFYSDA